MNQKDTEMINKPTGKALSSAADSHYLFKNRHGNTIKIPGSATIEDLVKLGVTHVSFKKPDEPLEQDEWRESGSSENDKD